MSLRISNSSSYLTRSTNLLDYNLPYTWMAWVYISVDRNQFATFHSPSASIANAQNIERFGTDSDGTTLRLVVGVLNTFTSINGSSLNVGQWYHVAIVRTSTTEALCYLDGVLDITNTANVSTRSAISVQDIGAIQGNNAWWNNGRTACVKEWNTDLSAAEVAAEIDTPWPVKTTDVWSYTPSLGVRDFGKDGSVNGYDYTEAGTLTSEDNPTAIDFPFVTSDIHNSLLQRTGTSTSTTISGTYQNPNTSPAAIEARLMDDATEIVPWATLDAAPTGGTFSGTMNVPNGGAYNIEVRFSNDTSAGSRSVQDWLMGAIFMSVGQSNTSYYYSDYGPTVTVNQDTRINVDGVWSIPTQNQQGIATFLDKYTTNTGIPSAGAVGNLAEMFGIGLMFFGTTSYLDNVDARGVLYATHVTEVLANIGGTLEGVITGQGGTDSNNSATEANYQTAVEAIISYIRADTGQSTLPIIQQYLLHYNNGNTYDQLQNVRRAQKNVVNTDSNVFEVSNIDLPLRDTVHLVDYIEEAVRTAQAAAFAEGSVSYYRGGTINSITEVDSTTTDVNMSNLSGTDFTPTTAITGFIVYDGGVSAAISAAVRQSPMVARLTHAAVSGVRTLDYDAGVPDVSDPIFSNDALILPFEWAESVGVFVIVPDDTYGGKKLAYYQGNGATSTQIDTAEQEFLIAQAQVVSKTADNATMWNELLVTLGYVGIMSGSRIQYWKDNGVIP